MKYWGPGMTVGGSPSMHRLDSATSVQQLEAQSRTGVVYDASHPRNSFAKKPHAVSATVISHEGQPQAIDWSQMGTQAIQQTMLHVAANPAALGHSPSMPAYAPIHPQNCQQAYHAGPQGYQAKFVTQVR